MSVRHRSPWIVLATLVLVGCQANVAPSPSPQDSFVATASAEPSTLGTATPSAAPTAAPTLAPSPTPTAGPTAWRATTSIPIPRAEHTATLLQDGRVLVVGGRAISFDASSNVSDETLASVLIFDPAREVWQTAASLHQPRNDQVAMLLHDGRVLVAGGFTPSAKEYRAHTIEVYDPARDVWRALSMPLPEGIDRATLLSDGRVLVSGFAGYGLASPHRDRQAYALFDPVTMSWSTVRVTDAIIGFASTVLLADGRVLAAGGAHASGDGPPQPTKLAAVFDPATLTWTSTEAMRQDHLGFGMGLLPDGRVLVADGQPELFDPATGHWALAARPAGSWWLPVGASLADGRYLIVGQQGTIDSIGVSQLYDGASGQWRDAGAFPITESLTATLLADGRVLVVGGLVTCYAGTGCHNDTLTGNSYLFDPTLLP